MEHTQHAEARKRSRGVSDETINTILLYGRTKWTNGAFVTDMGRKALEDYLDREDTPQIQNLGKLKKLYLVDTGDRLITVAYKNKKWRSKFR